MVTQKLSRALVRYTIVVISLSGFGAAFAASTDPYFVPGLGGAYLSESKLGSTSVTRTDHGPVAFAAPTGPYLVLGFGGAYLSGSKLGSASITRTDHGPFDFSYSIQYRQKSAFDYVGSTAIGYFFNNDPSNVSAWGIEAGFNYFVPKTSTVKNQLYDPISASNYPVTTLMKTNAWSADLEGVYIHNLIIPHTAVFFKLGIGYEKMTNKITNAQGLPDQLPNSKTTTTDGLGVAGGIGLQYNFTHYIGLRLEVDGLKGKKNIGYAQSILGLVLSFN